MESLHLEYLSLINQPIKQSGDTLVFMGKVYTVVLGQSPLAHEKPIISCANDIVEILHASHNRWAIQDSIIAFMRRQAQKTLATEIRELSHQMNLPFNRLSIRHAKTRWGSCTSQGNVNLNWQLIRMDRQLREYVMIHELCHLVHMNHSRDFWDLVGTFCPHYKAARGLLKKVNPHWIDGIYRKSLWRSLVGF